MPLPSDEKIVALALSPGRESPQGVGASRGVDSVITLGKLRDASAAENHSTNSPSCYVPTGAAITSLVGSGGIPDVARQAQFSAKLTF